MAKVKAFREAISLLAILGLQLMLPAPKGLTVDTGRDPLR